jgi:hypothetical protein
MPREDRLPPDREPRVPRRLAEPVLAGEPVPEPVPEPEDQEAPVAGAVAGAIAGARPQTLQYPSSIAPPHPG